MFKHVVLVWVVSYECLLLVELCTSLTTGEGHLPGHVRGFGTCIAEFQPTEHNGLQVNVAKQHLSQK